MFTDMRNGTAQDWAHIAAEHGKHQKTQAPKQIMESLARLKDIEVGFAADQLTHSLMAATLARRAGASDEEVVAALCHDLGKLFSHRRCHGRLKVGDLDLIERRHPAVRAGPGESEAIAARLVDHRSRIIAGDRMPPDRCP